MTKWRLQARAWLPVLASVACAAGLAVGTGDAQVGGLVYEKQLNLGHNPTPARGAEEPGPPPPEPDAAFYEQTLSLPALVPDAGGDGARGDRVIGGKPAPRGKWKSAVNIHYYHGQTNSRRPTGYCGGSLIDARWVLTAAHCVFRTNAGGLRTLKWVTAYANDTRFAKGRALRVKAVFVHRDYDEPWIINDVALLELERPTNLPRQKLAAAKGRPNFLAPGNRATIVGWGRTTPWFGPGSKQEYNSPVLLEASIPIADKATCDAFRKHGWGKPGRPLSDADFCAGHGQDKRPITCNGDSGGPIFVAGPTGEAIQAGVVSWGRMGCPSFYAAYANVGYFEAWIRKHVPNAAFVMPGPAGPSGPLQRIAGFEPGGPPAPHGQCAVDIRVDGAAANRVRVGSRLTVRVATGVTGHLAVFNRSPGNKRVQLFPNTLGGAAHSGATPTAVRAGDVIAIPGDAGAFEVTPPEGRYEIVAIVVPEGVDLADITRPFMNMAPIGDFEAVLAAIEERTRQKVESNVRAPRAVCTRQFVVVS